MTVLARLAFLLAAACIPALAQGDVQRLGGERECPPGAHGGLCLRISGWIVNEDVTRIRGLGAGLAEAAGRPPHVLLHSRGGDVDAAIALGHHLRLLSATAVVGEDAECLSACVFVLAGATQRSVAPKAKVGIHRPYLVPARDRTRHGVKREYERLEVVARTFLREVNVPVALFDAMARTPSDSMTMLTPAELSRFRLNQRDPVWAGNPDAAELRRYRIDGPEYVRRKRVGADLCSDAWTAGQRNGRFDAYFACTGRVMATGGG